MRGSVLPQGNTKGLRIATIPSGSLKGYFPFLESYVEEMWAHWMESEVNEMIKQMEKMTSEK